MTHPTPAEVTAADRELEEAIGPLLGEIVMGRATRDDLLQLIARHRLAANRGGEREREAVAQIVYEAALSEEGRKSGMRFDATNGGKRHWLRAADRILALPTADRGQGVPEGWRPEVRAFADLMEAQLRENDHKPGWKNDLAMDLIPRLREEAVELEEATNRHAKRIGWGDHWLGEDTSVRVGKEAADVANFAMMIADVCGALSLPAAPNGEA